MSLNYINYLNVAGYILNTLGTYAIGFFGAGDLPDNGEVSAKYQTLVTPAAWAFAIWGLIFLSQLIFVVLQLLPRFRAHPMVQQGAKYWYFVTCVAQFAWTPVFAYEKIALSSVFMAAILVPLVFLVMSQYKTPSDGTRIEFWLLRFPFSVHCGWIVAAFAVNINAAAVAGGASADTQYVLAIFSIIYVVIVAGVCLIYLKKPNYTVAAVLAWATFGIALELRSPKDLIIQTFSVSQISTIRSVSGGVCAALVICTIVRALFHWRGQSSDQERDTNENSYLSSNQQGAYS